MIDTPRILQATAQLTALIHLTVPRSEMRTVMGPGIGEVMAAMKVARTVLHGGYEGLGAAWVEFVGWIKAGGHQPAPDLYECYVAGPESSPDPANWRTELSRPLTG